MTTTFLNGNKFAQCKKKLSCKFLETYKNSYENKTLRPVEKFFIKKIYKMSFEN